MRSLQRRVMLGGLAWAVLATLIGAYAVTSVFDQIANQRFNETLQERHAEVIVALGDAQSPEGIEAVLTEPAYGRIYSGRYWQVIGEGGECYTSPSLFDAQLPKVQATEDGVEVWEGLGPNGPVRGLRERIILEDGSAWTVLVASNMTALVRERAEMQKSVLYVFGLVGLFGVASAALLTSVMVAPLRKLSDDVQERWDTEKALDPDDYPTEVAPLVTDINELISRNRDVIARGRRQAADLAHALKTPSAAMRNQIITISRKVDGMAPLLEALDRIDAQITRSLARMRAANVENAVLVRTDVDHAVRRMERLFRSMPDNGNVSFEVRSHSVNVAIDTQDLEEMLGNLLENAFKWCRSTVRLTVTKQRAMVRVLVEDDGPGISEAQRAAVLEEGGRLDTSVPGTGLGLSIVNDLATAYGASLELDQSDRLGGLCCTISLPVGTRKISKASALSA